MSFDTLTLYADTFSGKVVPVSWSSNCPSGLFSLYANFSTWWAQDVNCEPSYWQPPVDKYLTYNEGEIDVDAAGIDALAVAALDIYNPLGLAICGATYKVSDRGHFLCTLRNGSILEKMFPQGCTLTFNFERRLKDYISSTSKVKFSNILEILKR